MTSFEVGLDHFNDDGTTEMAVARWLWVSLSPALLVLGVVGNLLTLVVLSSSASTVHYSQAGTLFLRTLAITDCMVLMTGLLRHFIEALSGIDIRSTSVVMCKGFTFLTYLFASYASWLVAVLSVERMTIVVSPLSGKIRWTRAASIIITVILFLCDALKNTPLLFSVTLMPGNSTTGGMECYCSSASWEQFMLSIWPYVDLVISFALPFTIILACNLAIISKILVQSRQRCRKISDTSVPLARVYSRVTGITLTLLAVSGTFLLLNGPLMLYLSMQVLWLNNSNMSGSMELVYACTALLFYTSNAINFILYSATNLKFRAELGRIFCKATSTGSSLGRWSWILNLASTSVRVGI